MQISNLAMARFNTTLMGVLKGVLDYYGIGVSAPMLFGASGHAFLINTHEELCPSGPYCWRRDLAEPLICNLGLEMVDLGLYSPKSSEKERAYVEEKLREGLDKGIPCSLLNRENQLITGYDDDGFFTAQPWAPKVDFPPARLSFATWEEFGEEFHANFYIIEKRAPAEPRAAVLASLGYAVDLHKKPARHSLEGYGVGPNAYANWIKAVPEHGSSHGNWWNGTVWSECRQMASDYFAEIGEEFPEVSPLARDLSRLYAQIADRLGRASDREMGAEEKVALLEQASEEEAAAIQLVVAVAASLRDGS